MNATEHDLSLLEAIYKDRTPYFGELHDHAATGGTSDGKRNLDHWKGALEALHMDFAAILDHKQVRHMYLPEWEDGLFICGTEPGTKISDSPAEDPHVHYNMIFDSPAPLEALLSEFPEFEFEGGQEGHFRYPHFTTERFGELIDAVKTHGGFFVHPHPKQLMKSEEPLDYWFRDETAIEVFYGDMANKHTENNYALWVDLLARGKRLWAAAGGDGHKCCADTALTAIYAEEHKNASYLSHLRMGDFVCGSVALKMCVDGTPMGGVADFDGGRLVLGIEKFHRSVRNPEHRYRVDLLSDKGVVLSEEILCGEPSYFAIDTDTNAKFYRAEVFDVTRNLRIAIGNPIWAAVPPAMDRASSSEAV